MKARLKDKPRKFSPLVGIEINDCGEIELGLDEQITVATEEGTGNDIVRKEWGFYLSNSLNANLAAKGFKTALVVSYASDPPRTYLNLVERDKMAAFDAYLRVFHARVVCWLDEWFSPAG
jgi:hypothetical protein